MDNEASYVCDACGEETGAVCGQFAGACWGESGIPREWLSGLARRDMIEKGLAGLLDES